MKYVFLSVAIGFSIAGAFIGGFVLGRKAEAEKPLVEHTPAYEGSYYSYSPE